MMEKQGKEEINIALTTSQKRIEDKGKVKKGK